MAKKNMLFPTFQDNIWEALPPNRKLLLLALNEHGLNKLCCSIREDKNE